ILDATKQSFEKMHADSVESMRENEDHFLDVIQRSECQFAIATRRHEEVINSTIGGDSYPIISMSAENDSEAWPVMLSHGKYPIRHVNGSVYDMVEFNQKTHQRQPIRTLLNIGTHFDFPVIATKSAQIFGPVPFASASDDHEFTALIFADNGSWNETIRLHKV